MENISHASNRMFTIDYKLSRFHSVHGRSCSFNFIQYHSRAFKFVQSVTYLMLHKLCTHVQHKIYTVLLYRLGTHVYCINLKFYFLDFKVRF